LLNNELKKCSKIIQNINTTNNIILSIPEFDIYDDKLLLWDKLLAKFGRKIASQVMPECYKVPYDLKYFKKKYKNNNKYIMKKLYRGGKSGVHITKDYNEIINNFKNGPGIEKYSFDDYRTTGWEKLPFHLVQEYINNPLLIQGYKFNIRFFMIVTYVNNKLEYYLYKDAVLGYTENKFNYNSVKKIDNITSLVINNRNSTVKKLFQEYPYLLSQLNIHDKCIKQLKTKLLKIIDAYDISVKYNHTMFHIFGGDAEINNNKELYIYELNQYPALQKYYSNSRRVLL
jgi:hypothetical protein